MGGWKKRFLSNEEDGSKVYLVGYSTTEQKSKLQGVLQRLHNTPCMTRHFVTPFNGGEPEQLFTGRKGVTDLFTCEIKEGKDIPGSKDGRDLGLKMPKYVGFRVPYEEGDPTVTWLKSRLLHVPELANVFRFGKHAIELREAGRNDRKFLLTKPVGLPDGWAGPMYEDRRREKSYEVQCQVIHRYVKTPNPEWDAMMRDEEGRLLKDGLQRARMIANPSMAPYTLKVEKKAGGYIVGTRQLARNDKESAKVCSKAELEKLKVTMDEEMRRKARARRPVARDDRESWDLLVKTWETAAHKWTASVREYEHIYEKDKTAAERAESEAAELVKKADRLRAAHEKKKHTVQQAGTKAAKESVKEARREAKKELDSAQRMAITRQAKAHRLRKAMEQSHKIVKRNEDEVAMCKTNATRVRSASSYAEAKSIDCQCQVAQDAMRRKFKEEDSAAAAAAAAEAQTESGKRKAAEMLQPSLVPKRPMTALEMARDILATGLY